MAITHRLGRTPAPGARPHIPVDRRAPLEEFERIASRIPVFHITARAD
ncbi:hypothetical protein [Nonomuraea aurantiaca]|nr:hypothetical protein [Nonomuraea aurantiaca]MCA2229938.1 hypothetical protein [Nonomuraea aurantiaca]